MPGLNSSSLMKSVKDKHNGHKYSKAFAVWLTGENNELEILA
jgi:hypothetical protein